MRELDVLECGYRVANQYTAQKDLQQWIKWAPYTAELFLGVKRG